MSFDLGAAKKPLLRLGLVLLVVVPKIKIKYLFVELKNSENFKVSENKNKIVIGVLFLKDAKMLM
jgi:hypothetical protein